MSRSLVIFTMKGCPYCVEFKDKLSEESIQYHDLDINDHTEEYDMFMQIVGNDLVPSFMIIDDKKKSEFFAPDRDYEEIDEAIEIIKNKL